MGKKEGVDGYTWVHNITSSYPGWIKSPHVVTCHTYFPIGKICHNFIFSIFGGRGGILQLKSQSAKICLNFNFSGGGGILQLKSQSAKISDNFHFRGGGYSVLQNRGKL